MFGPPAAAFPMLCNVVYGRRLQRLFLVPNWLLDLIVDDKTRGCLPEDRDMTSECTFCSNFSDLWAEMLNEANCDNIPWHNIQDRSRRCLSSDPRSEGER